MKPVRILHVIGILNRGGAEAMIMNLYRKIDRNKVQFDFVENTYETGIYEDEILSLGGRIFHCPKFAGNVFSYMKWWNRFFDEHKNEYAFVHGHIGSTAAMYLASAKKHGIKTIAHSHSTYTKSFNLKQFQYQVLSYPTRYISDYFFACSEDAGTSRYGSRVTCHVVKNAIDTSIFRYDQSLRKSTREELGIDQDLIVLGHVGRFTAEKNHSFILKVFKTILKRKNAILLLVGDGPLRKTIEKEAENLGISTHIYFLGVRDDISALMNCMDIMIFPSLFEGFGIVALEAQAVALRTLCSTEIPKECQITEYFYSQDLGEGVERWAVRLESLLDYQRISPTDKIIKAGYDIKENATWLQNFYLNGGY